MPASSQPADGDRWGPLPWAPSLGLLFGRTMPRAQRARIRAEVDTLREDIRGAGRRLRRRIDPEAAWWLELANQRLENAVRLARDVRSDPGESWRAVHRTREAWVATLDPVAMKLEARDVVRRAYGLSKGRKKQVEALLGEEFGKDTVAGRRARLSQAFRTRNEEYEYEAEQALIARSRMIGMGLIVGMGLLILLGGLIILDKSIVVGTSWRFSGAVMLMGALGGAMVAMRDMVGPADQKTLPKFREDAAGMVVRPVVGSASAVVIVWAVSTGLLGFEVATHRAYLPLAFVAGFTEVLLAGLVARVTGAASPAKKEETPDDPKADAETGTGAPASNKTLHAKKEPGARHIKAKKP